MWSNRSGAALRVPKPSRSSRPKASVLLYASCRTTAPRPNNHIHSTRPSAARAVDRTVPQQRALKSCGLTSTQTSSTGRSLPTRQRRQATA